MPKFGTRSEINLHLTDPRLIKVFREVIKRFDCAVICGLRGQAEQNRLYDLGKTKLRYPGSKHNLTPALAVDAVPYYPNGDKIRWNDYKGFSYFAGYVIRTAEIMRVKLRWAVIGTWILILETKAFMIYLISRL